MGTEIHGHVDESYGAVADAFRSKFEERHEQGAAFALRVDGDLVDLVALNEKPDLADILAVTPMVEALAVQKPIPPTAITPSPMAGWRARCVAELTAGASTAWGGSTMPRSKPSSANRRAAPTSA
ncbi:MAG: hypothetical protein GY698_15865 [Actinomycetia bacterium]|nr:hypothetical protein [Actinomycetes bacterium]